MKKLKTGLAGYRQLPHDSVLIYRRGRIPQSAQNYVQFCAQVRDRRMVRWHVMIVEGRHAENLELEVDQYNWEAFLEVPDVFAALADKIHCLKNVNDTLHTLDTVETLLNQHGAVKDTDDD